MCEEKPSRVLIDLSGPPIPCQNRHQPSVTWLFSRTSCVTDMYIPGAVTASGAGGSDGM